MSADRVEVVRRRKIISEQHRVRIDLHCVPVRNDLPDIMVKGKFVLQLCRLGSKHLGAPSRPHVTHGNDIVAFT